MNGGRQAIFYPREFNPHGGWMEVTMKKLRLLLVLLILSALLCLSGCVNIYTTMTVSSEFAGQRVMTVSFPANQLQSAGGLEDVDELIDGAKPALLEYKRSDSADPVEYIFTLRFNSLEDYEKKVESLAMRDVSIEYVYVNQPYTREIRLTEDFDSSDLFVWFDQVLNGQKDVIEAAFGKQVNTENIWTVTGYTLELDGETDIVSSKKISYSRGSGDLITGVEMTTVIHGDEKYTRYIDFRLSRDCSENDRNAIIDRMSASLPEGGSIEQNVGAGGSSCTVSFSATTAQQLADMTTRALEGRRSTSVWGDFDDKSQPLTTLNGFEESLDLSAFSSDDQLDFTYRIVSEDGLPNGLYSKETGSLSVLEAEIGGNTLTYNSNGTSFNFYTILASVSKAQTISYGLVVDGEEKFIREVRIIMPAGSEGAVLSQVESYFASLGAPNTEIITSGSAEQPYVLITIRGNASEICSAEDILFGVTPNRRLSYTREGGLLTVKPDAYLIDSYDISSLLSLTGVSDFIYVVSTGDEVYECSVADDSSLPTDSPIAVRCNDGAQSMSFTGKYVNSDAVIFICLLVVLLLLLIALAVTMYLAKLAEKNAEKEEKPAELTEGEETKALPIHESRDFLAVMEDPEPIVPTAPMEVERFEDSISPVYDEPVCLPEPEALQEDMLGIFTGVDLGEEDYQPKPEAEPELMPMPEPEPEPESVPEPEPVAEPEPEREPVKTDVYEGYEDRFPMENLPPVVESPENTTDKYSNSDFVNDLRYLGYLDSYTKRATRVKVKVRKRSRSEDQNK